MSRKRKVAETLQTQSRARAVSLVVIALLAFAAGCFITWVVMRQPTNANTQTAAASSRGVSGELPPDTSRMSPAQAALMLGNWHYDRKRWPEAITSYQQAIQLGLDNPDVRTDMGNCYRFSSQPQKALEQYRIAQSLNPQHEQSLFNTATLHAQVLNDPVKASEVAREYVRRFPQGQSIVAAKQLLAGVGEQNDERANVAEWLKSQASPTNK